MYSAQLRKYFSLLLPFIFLFLPLTGHAINLGPPPSGGALLNVPRLAPTASGIGQAWGQPSRAATITLQE